MRQVALYLPRPASSLWQELARGTAIVGEQQADGRVLIYYERTIHEASDTVTLADRAHHAADRMLAHYPTSARRVADARDLRRVGTFDSGTGCITVTSPGDLAEIARWLGFSESDAAADSIQGELRMSTPPRVRGGEASFVRSGIEYEPWQGSGGEVGYKCTRVCDGNVTYIYLNPSDDAEDSPDVFVYQAPHGDPACDEPEHYYLINFSERARTSRSAECGQGRSQE